MSFQEIITNLKEIIKLYPGKDLHQIFSRKIRIMSNNGDFSKSELMVFLAKYFIQFIFKHSLVVSKRYKKFIRHKFPPRFGENDRTKVVKFINKLLDITSMNIQMQYDKINPYFSISDYTSLINIILCWKNSLFDLNSAVKERIKEVFKKSLVLIFFKPEFIERIFGIDGILKREGLSVDNFVKTLNSTPKSYSRQRIDHYKKHNYFPVEFLKLLIIRYEEFNDYFDYIERVQLGKIKSDKQAKTVNKRVLDEIKNNYDLFSGYISFGSSNFGWIFQQSMKIGEQEDFEYIDRYLKHLERAYNTKTLEKYEDEIDWITHIMGVGSPEALVISSIRMTNFKSYVSQTINFENGMNVIYGLNGSGKTTIIEAILFALLRLHPKHSITYSPPLYEAMSPLFIFVINTWLIRFGADEAEVELRLKRGDEYINIRRKITRSGYQEIMINDMNLLDQNVLGIGDGYVGNKEFNIVRDDFHDGPWLDSHSMTTLTWEASERIFNIMKDLRIFLEKDEIFTSFYNEYQLFWNWDSEYFGELDLDVTQFYKKKFGMSLLYAEIEKRIKEQKKFKGKKIQENLRLSLRLLSENLYDEINRNKWFSIYSGSCYSCQEKLYNIEEERSELGLPSNNISIDHDVKREYGGLVCQQCGQFFCDRCMTYLDFCPSEDCGGELAQESYLDWESYKRREYSPFNFYSLIGENSDKYKELVEKVRERDIIIKGTEDDIFLNVITEADLEDIKRLVNDKAKITWLNKFEVKVNEKAHEKLKLSEQILDNNIRYIVAIIKNLMVKSKKSDRSERNVDDIKLNIPKLRLIQKASEEFRIFDIITHFSMILIYKYLKFEEGTSITDLDNLYGLIKESHPRVNKSFEEFIDSRKKGGRVNWADIYLKQRKDIYYFEIKLLNLLHYFLDLVNSDLMSEEIYESLTNDECGEEIINFVNLSNNIVEPKLKFSNEESFEYNFKEYHELDFKVLKSQIKNQLGIINKIIDHNTTIDDLNSRISDMEERIKFLNENADFMYTQLYLRHLNNEIEKLSSLIFENKEFSCYIDKQGIPKLRYKNDQGSVSILILSSGEKNKLFLAILGTLLSISKKNQFILIDEPNELLDEKNIDVMKEFFLIFFQNKQILLSTYIKNYKDFKPALRFHVYKNEYRHSEIERIAE